MTLDPRQYKIDSIQSKIIQTLKNRPFFDHLYGEGKSAAISKLELFLLYGVILILSLL